MFLKMVSKRNAVRFEDFHSYSGLVLEIKFMASDSQRQSIINTLQLHLEICENQCSNHNLFGIENGFRLSHYYGTVPVDCQSTKKNKNLKVQFNKTVEICLDHTYHSLFLGNSLLDSTCKEFIYVPPSSC